MSEPKYTQTKAFILRMIDEGPYESGSRLPTEAELAARFRVSRNTLRQAIGELVSEGILVREQGRGTFYTGPRDESEQKTGLIGVLTPLPQTYIFGELIHGMDDVAQSMGYSLVLATSRADPEREVDGLRNLLSKPLDGLLVEFARSAEMNAGGETARLIRDAGLPTLVCDTDAPVFDLSAVLIDDVYGGRLATEYLIQQGHRRIAMVYKETNTAGVRRLEGYLEALAAAGIRRDDSLILAYRAQEDTLPVVPLARKLASMPPGKRPTAVFFFNDQCAIQSFAPFEDEGLRVPDDVSFVGFDDSELAVTAPVPLTSVIHPKYWLGWLAARTLIDMMQSELAGFCTRTFIRPTLAIRDSVRQID